MAGGREAGGRRGRCCVERMHGRFMLCAIDQRARATNETWYGSEL